MITALCRTVILYFLIMIGLRLMGKRQIGELEPSELVLTMMISDLATVPMQDFGIPLLAGVIPILILLSLTLLMSQLSLLNLRFRALMCGTPAILIRNGKLQQAAMRKNRYTLDELLEQLRSVEARRKELRAREAHLLERRDILEMQQQEIDKVAPEAGEEERLEEQRAIVRAAEQTREQYELALGLLHGEEEPGLLDMLGRLERCLHQMARTDDSVSEDADAVTALRQQLSHLSGRLRRPPLPEDMPDVEQMEERLYALAQLKRKLHRSLDEILELREEIRENISFLDACALDITLLDKEEKQLAAQLQEVLSALLPQRREAAADFARQLEEELRQLGFSEQVRVIPDFMPQEVWPGLMDEKVRILWAPNPGQAPQPLDRIASGGELSRFLLALMSVRPKAESATYIFDEVDAGVGGLTLNKLAEKLENLAKQRQMLVITHWPQLAARAQKHFQISKTIRDNATFTTCVPLDARQRHAELVRMAGGGQQGEALAASLEGRSYQLTMF
mgnify:CR=1 FL=1